jgi:hypothetical protein
MIVAKTPWLKYNDEVPSLPSYDLSKGKEPWFACAETVHDYFDIPEGSKIRFVVYNRPGKYRYSAKTQIRFTDSLGLTFNEDKCSVFLALEIFMRRFTVGKTYYVECEIK